MKFCLFFSFVLCYLERGKGVMLLLYKKEINVYDCIFVKFYLEVLCYCVVSCWYCGVKYEIKFKL